MTNRTEYKEIARAAVTKNRNIIISKCSRGGFTIAQQVVVKDGESEVAVFMKGAIHIADLNALYDIRNAINWAIYIAEASPDTEELDWDE